MASQLRLSDGPSDRLAKLLPAEVTGLYMTIKGLCDQSTVASAQAILFWFIPIVILCGIAYLVVVRKIANQLHLAIYCIVFIVWVVTIEAAAIGAAINIKDGTVSLLAAIVSAILSFLVPLFIPSDKLSSGPDAL